MKPAPKPMKKPPGKGKKDMEREELRVLALQMAVSSTAKISANYLAKEPPFAGVISVSTLDKWRVADRWEERRDEFQRAVFQQFTAQASSRLVQMLMANLERLDPIERDMETAMSSLTFEGTSKVKLIETYLRVMEARSRYGEAAAKLLTPAPAAPVQPAVGLPQPLKEAANAQADTTSGSAAEEEFTLEEARVAAQAVLRWRQDQPAPSGPSAAKPDAGG